MSIGSSGDRLSRGGYLGRADLIGAVERLALEIGERDRVVVDHADPADPGRREILDRRRADAAGADQQDMAGEQPHLPRAAHFAQHDVAGIAFKFFGIEHQG